MASMLLLAARELLARLVAPLGQHLEQVVDAVEALLQAVLAAGRRAGQHEVLVHGEVGEDVPALHAVREAQPRHVVRGQAGDVLAGERDAGRRVTGIMPLMTRAAVVLPAPLVPSSATTSPRVHVEA